MGERADLDVEPDQAAQAGGQGGDADVPVAAVGDHDHVGAELVEVLLQQRREAVGPDLLLALDEHHHVDGEVVAVDPEGAEVGGDAGLVVGGAAGIEAPVALGGLERRGVPVGVVVLGLNIVVGVEQDRLRGLLPRPLVCDHRGPAAGGAGDLDLETLGREEVADRLGAALHLPGSLGVGAHRLDADQGLEVASYAGKHVARPRAEVVLAHGRQPNHRGSP